VKGWLIMLNKTGGSFTIISVLLIGLVVFICSGIIDSAPCHAKDLRDEIVEVSGVVGMGIDRTSALNDAMRLAIAKGKGMSLWSKTLVSDAITVSDTIDTLVNGFIEDFEITGERKSDIGYEIEIAAKVHLKEVSKLSGDASDVILKRSGNPRVIIISAEKVTGGKSVYVQREWKITADYLKELLVERNFYVIEEGDWSKGKNKRIDDLGENVLDAVELGIRNNADIVIFLNAEARYKGSKDLGKYYGASDVSYHSWEGKVKAEAVLVHERRVIALENSRVKKKGRDLEETMEAVLQQGIDKVAGKFITEILIRLNFYNNNGTTVQVSAIGNINGETISQFKEALETVPGVRQVNVKKGVSGYGFRTDVVCNFNAGCLAKQVETQFKAFGLELSKMTLNTLIYKAKIK